MFTTTPTCINPAWFLQKLRISPIVGARATIKDCAPKLGSSCAPNNIPEDFLNRIADAANEAVQAITYVTGKSPCYIFECETIKYPVDTPLMGAGGYVQKTAGIAYAGTTWGNVGGNYYYDGHAPMKQKDCHTWKSVELRNNNIIFPGTERKEFIRFTDDVRYTDEDGDGFRETVTITYDLGFTPDYDICELILYHIDGSDNIYRLKGLKSRSIAGTVVTWVYNTWDLIKPSASQQSIAEQFYGVPKATANLCCEFDGNDMIVDPDECPLAATLHVWRNGLNRDTCPALLAGYGNNCGCGQDTCMISGFPACVQLTDLCNSVRLVPATVNDDGECVATGHCGCTVPPVTGTVNYLGGCVDCWDNCYDPDFICPELEEALFELMKAWLDIEGCSCETGFDEIDDAQVKSEELPQAEGPFYDSIVRNNYVGERKAWGLLQKPIAENCYT